MAARARKDAPVNKVKALSHPTPPASKMQAHAPPPRTPGPAAAPIRNLDPDIRVALAGQPPAVRAGVLEVARRKGST
jgi:hypothetical protein